MRKQSLGTLVMLGVAAIVVLADQLAKHLVMTYLPEGASWIPATWLMPFMKVTHVTNTGVAFGLFPGLGGLVVLIAVVVVVIIVLYQRSLPHEPSSPHAWLLHIALGLQLGGAISNNLIDRLRYGFVVDFIDLNFWPLEEWPVFNLADSSIVVGVLLLILVMFLEERREQKTRQITEMG